MAAFMGKFSSHSMEDLSHPLANTGGFGADARLGGPIAVMHEKKVVDEETRMWMNGESPEQMAHAMAIKAAGGVSPNEADGNDTSKDQKWDIDESTAAIWTDRYVLVTTAMWLLVKIAILAIPLMVLHVLPMSVAHLYMATLPDRTQRPHRTPCFYCCFSLGFLFALPAVVLVVIGLLCDYLFYYLFSVLYCMCTCRWLAAYKSMRAIDPYRNGPCIVWHLSDFFACVVGQSSRQAPGEVLWMICVMWLIIPWLKYYVNCNPWIQDLDHRMVQQISSTMQDLGTPQDVSTTARAIISMARQDRDIAEALDVWSFVPHYPYPPVERRWALGMQAGGAEYPGKFTLIVHTTHAVAEVDGSQQQFVLSNSCAEPIYRVMLWYNNPFHFLTGWVEASVSTGLPTQPIKHHGGEHPMWLVTGRTPMTAGRDSWTGSGMIDSFFDYWLPVFVHEMRFLTNLRRGKGLEESHKIADDKYEEVVSKDGISEPCGKIGRDKYEKMDTLSIFQKVGEDQRKDMTQSFGRRLCDLSETKIGQWAAKIQQGEDIHEDIHEGYGTFSNEKV